MHRGTSVAASTGMSWMLSRRSPTWMPAFAAGTAGRDIQGFDAAVAIDPNHAIVGKAETELRFKINEGGHTRGQREDREDVLWTTGT